MVGSSAIRRGRCRAVAVPLCPQGCDIPAVPRGWSAALLGGTARCTSCSLILPARGAIPAGAGAQTPPGSTGRDRGPGPAQRMRHPRHEGSVPRWQRLLCPLSWDCGHRQRRMRICSVLGQRLVQRPQPGSRGELFCSSLDPFESCSSTINTCTTH